MAGITVTGQKENILKRAARGARGKLPNPLARRKRAEPGPRLNPEERDPPSPGHSPRDPRGPGPGEGGRSSEGGGSYERGRSSEGGRSYEGGGSYEGGRSLREKVKIALLVPTNLAGIHKFYSFPDKDISLLGIGRHRYFLFHSAIPLYLLKRLYRQYQLTAGKGQGPLGKTGRVVVGGLLSGASLGVGIHLLVDVFQPKAVIFPLVGSLVNGTLLDDRLWLLGNSLWCFQIAGETMYIALGKDLESPESRLTRLKKGGRRLQKRIAGPRGQETC